MRKNDLIWILLIFVIGIIAFLTSSNLLISIAVALLYLAYYFFVARKRLNNYSNKIERIHCCYHFINSFLVTLSTKESLEDAYQSGLRIDNKKLNEISKSIENLSIYDRVIYLRTFFNLSIYKMFINILDLYQDQGGNILSMSGNLLRECTRVEKTLNESLSIGQKHIVEFLLLWVMSFGVVLFMRFGISEFYSMMVAKPVFLMLLFCYFMICLVSVHLFLVKYTNLTIKEDVNQ